MRCCCFETRQQFEPFLEIGRHDNSIFPNSVVCRFALPSACSKTLVACIWLQNCSRTFLHGCSSTGESLGQPGAARPLAEGRYCQAANTPHPFSTQAMSTGCVSKLQYCILHANASADAFTCNSCSCRLSSLTRLHPVAAALHTAQTKHTNTHTCYLSCQRVLTHSRKLRIGCILVIHVRTGHKWSLLYNAAAALPLSCSELVSCH